MPPSSPFISFATVACKIALVLSTIGYAGVVAHRMREQNAQLRKEAKEARAERDELLQRMTMASEDSKAARTEEEQKQDAEAEHWRRKEELAREELEKKDAALRDREAELVAQREQIRDLEAHLHDARVPQAQVLPSGSDSEASARGSRDVSHEPSSPHAGLPDAQSTVDDGVLHMVRTLNLEISEVASQVTNAFHVAETPDPGRVTLAFEHAREAVGPVMAELLESIQHQDDPILIDIALKADMVGFAAEISSAWDFQHQSKSVFTGVYKQMRRSGTRVILLHSSCTTLTDAHT